MRNGCMGMVMQRLPSVFGQLPVSTVSAGLFLFASGCAVQGAPEANLHGARTLRAEARCPRQGVLFELPISSLPQGWVVSYEAPYGDHTKLTDIQPGGGAVDLPENFDCILLGAKRTSFSSAFFVAAFADRWKFETGSHFWNNGVYWYTAEGLSAGFAGDSNVRLEPGDKGTFGGARRLSWHLSGDRGGFRAGLYSDLDFDGTWRKVVMHGPQGVFCEEFVCGDDEVLKVQDLPDHCMGSACTPEECCAKRKACTSSECGLRWTLKPNLPALCASTVCLESECCMQAPSCSADTCSGGYVLMPDGLPPYCSSHTCRQEECCQLAPLCPAELCTGDFVLPHPVPRCSTIECLAAEECCVRAGRCSASVCPAGFVLKTKELLPPHCGGPTCMASECCEQLPPTVNVTSGTLVDLDLDAGTLGGNITWVPPPWEGTITHFAVYLGTASSSSFQGNVSWGTNTLSLPSGTPAAPFLIICTCSRAVVQENPPHFLVRDIALTPTSVSFSDLDLDEREVGGVVQWADPLANSPENDPLAAICRSGAALAVRSGSTDTEGDAVAFFFGREQLPSPTAENGVSVAVLDEGLQEVLQVGLFHTGQSSSESVALERFLENLPEGTTVLLALAGDATAHLHAGARAAIESYGARELGGLEPSDAYALIGTRGAEDRMAESLARAASGHSAVAAFQCPLSHFTVYLSGLDANDVGLLKVGMARGGSNSLPLPADTAVTSQTQLLVHAASAFAEQSQPAVLRVVDSAVIVSDAKFERDDAVPNERVAGVVSWRGPPSVAAPVAAYRVYLAWNASGLGRMQVGADVSALWSSIYTFEVPTGTLRGNFTHLVVYAVSPLVEQDTPSAALPLEEANAAALTAALVATLSAVGVAQAASTAQAVQQQPKADLKALERCATQVEKSKSKPVKILGTFSNAGSSGDAASDTVVISARGEPPFLRQLLGPFLCGWVHHHPSCISVYHTKFRTRATLHRHTSCENSWGSGDWVLQKQSNSVISIQDSNGGSVFLQRRPARCRRCLEGPGKIILRIYAPLLALVGIAAVVGGMKFWLGAALLLAAALLCTIVVFAVSRSTCIQRAMKAVARAPPASIRERFWQTVELLVGMLPCVPAFMSSTAVGYVTGSLAVLTALGKAHEADMAAALLEIVGGTCVALISLLSRLQDYGNSDEESETAADPQLMAVFLASSLLIVKGLDGWAAGTANLYLDEPLPIDRLVVAAETTASTMQVGLCHALVLEAFTMGEVPQHMHRRLADSLQRAVTQLADAGQREVRQVLDELHGQNSGWRRVTSSLAKHLCRVIDTVSNDLGLSELVQVSGIDELAQATGLNTIGGRVLVEEVLKERVGPRLGDIEDALSKLLGGPLATKTITNGQQSATVMQTTLAELQTHVQATETCLGLHVAAGHLARTEILGVHTGRAALIAEEVKTEMEDGNLCPADLCMVRQRLAEIRELTIHTSAVLRTIAEEEPAGYADIIEEAHEAANSMLEALQTATEELHLEFAPSRDPQVQLASLQALGDVVEAASSLAALQQRLCEAAPLPDEVDAQKRPEAEHDVRQCACSLAAGPFREAADMLCWGRTAAGLIAAVVRELEVAAEAASGAALLMESARHEGLEVLATLSASRKGVEALTVEDLRRVQERAVGFATGAPVQALLLLQGLTSEALDNSFQMLAREVEAAHERAAEADFGEPPPATLRFSSIKRATDDDDTLRQAGLSTVEPDVVQESVSLHMQSATSRLSSTNSRASLR